jgi:hypothetical protein
LSRSFLGLVPSLALPDVSAVASWGTELAAASGVAAACAAGAAAGISSALLALGQAMSAINKPTNARALTTIKNARFMIFTFEFYIRDSCFLAQVSHQTFSKERTSRIGLQTQKGRPDLRGELLRWPRRFTPLFEVAQLLSETDRIH